MGRNNKKNTMVTKKITLNELKTLIKTIIKEETETHKTFLTMDDILRGIKSLAKSQGYYGRLYNTLMDLKENNPEQYDEIVNEFESQEFHDIVDFVMWIES